MAATYQQIPKRAGGAIGRKGRRYWGNVDPRETVKAAGRRSQNSGLAKNGTPRDAMTLIVVGNNIDARSVAEQINKTRSVRRER